jgi:L-asparaginase / beta-aspartyl-peptidase
MPIAMIVHGGAGDIASDRTEIAQAGCREAVLAGWRILQAGGSALDAVEAAVRSLEDNPNFNAGTGACLTTDGNIQLDAGIMDGHALSVGAVADVQLIKNPISLARKVLESPHVLLVGEGAQQFAQEQGIVLCRLEDLMTERQYDNWKAATSATPAHNVGADLSSPPPIYRPAEEKHGTVGAVALDTFGTLAAATSTGGIPNKYPGRVGDSPLIGCGFYADENAAISCTGHGEDFIRLLIAKRTADFVVRGDVARDAAQAAIAVLGARATGTGGLIVVDRLGNVGFAWNSQHMSHAYMIVGMEEPITGV